MDLDLICLLPHLTILIFDLKRFDFFHTGLCRFHEVDPFPSAPSLSLLRAVRKKEKKKGRKEGGGQFGLSLKPYLDPPFALASTPHSSFPPPSSSFFLFDLPSAVRFFRLKYEWTKKISVKSTFSATIFLFSFSGTFRNYGFALAALPLPVREERQGEEGEAVLVAGGGRRLPRPLGARADR